MHNVYRKLHTALWGGPLGIGLGIVIGAGIGLYWKPAARMMAPLGQIYVALLMMCVLPLVITSTTSGLARLMRADDIQNHVKRLLVFFLVALLVPSVVGMGTAVLFKPGGRLSQSTLDVLGTLTLASAPTAEEPPGLLPFLVTVVPPNIFESLSKGHIVSVVFSCILIGLALGLVQSKGAEDLVQFLDVIADSFNLIFRWALSVLPVGLCFSLAGQLAALSLGVVVALFKFIVMFYLGAFLLVCLYSVLLWRAAGGTLSGTVKALGKPMLLAYTVDSSLVALSSCLQALDQRLHVDRRLAGLILPFGLIANRQGKICLFAFTAVFLAQLYGLHLGIESYLVVMVASSLAGMAAVGSGVVLAAALITVLHTIAVPDVLAPVVLITAGPIIDRMQSTLTVLGNCTLTALVANPKTERRRTTGSVTPLAMESETY